MQFLMMKVDNNTKVILYMTRGNSRLMRILEIFLSGKKRDVSLSSFQFIELSGGQQQRAAILRAVVNKPPLLLCDEPTGSLNSAQSELVMDLLNELNQNGQTIILVTHDIKAAVRGKRVVYIEDGRMEGELFTYGVNKIYSQYKPDGQENWQSIVTELYELPWNDKIKDKSLYGRRPVQENEIGVGLALAEKYGFDVGENIELFVNGEKKEYEITGIFQTLSSYGNVIRMEKISQGFWCLPWELF